MASLTWLFYSFAKALADQKTMKFAVIDGVDLHQIIGYALMAIGQLFVWTSFWQLGITGTYLGDYCGYVEFCVLLSFTCIVLLWPLTSVGVAACSFLRQIVHGTQLVPIAHVLIDHTPAD